MQQIKLLQLNLKNFKGVNNFTLDLQGENVKVYGDNATGKTTLFDGFIWLLFDKDSQNKKDFSIKTLNKVGTNLHGLEHEVEGIFLINGKEFTLRKVFTEKWTKKRGAAQSEFSGHTTDYFIDGVPAKKKEFTDKVSEIVSEDIFKLLTSPSYFNDQLKWQDRRTTLLEICGDITNEEVINGNNALSKLPGILKGRSIEDHRKVIGAKRTEINKELDRIPIRIDEVQRSTPDLSGLDEQSLNDEITYLKNAIVEKEQEISRIQSGGEISNKEKQLRVIEGELIQLKNEHQIASHEKVNGKRRELFNLQGDLDSMQHDLKRKERHIFSNQDTVSSLLRDKDLLTKEWHSVNSRVFEDHHDSNCPTCGQALPVEEVQAAHDKALSSFNLKKAHELESITSRGKATAAKIQDYQEQNKALEQELQILSVSITEKQASINILETEINDLQKDVKDIQLDPVYKTKLKQQEIVNAEILELKTSVIQSLSNARDELSKLKNEISALEQDRSKFIQVKQAEVRITELQDQEKDLARQFEDLEQQLFLTEEFIRTKVNLLEDKINSKFRYARFNLFKTNINGGLEEICETTFDGVPYSSGLNNAARINVGLDIINTLSEHYGVIAPIFVDNSEAVTQLIDVNSQIISLVVSEADKKLRVEYGNHKEAI
ncbi:AAA family ATPase [Metabacillus herbersteinensis]|uniref:Nuclease SbcCD subunit C n=1 Tax=Metabacillus herbersteinensis TaxID=283816 RepID=A0ABV6GBQ1_9BACI